MQSKGAKYVLKLLLIIAAAFALRLGLKFLLPLTAPFILAFALAAAMEPAVRALCRRGWKRSAAAGLMTLSILGLIIWAVSALAAKGISAATDFAGRVPEMMDTVGRSLGRLERGALDYILSAPDSVESYMKTAMDALGEALYAIPAALSQKMLDILGTAARKSPSIILFMVTAGLGSYFFSSSYPENLAFISAQLPESLLQKIKLPLHELRSSLGGFLRAQLILMAMTFFQLLPAFLLLKIENAPGIAALTALVDALPVFGTGTILLPWALYSLLLGNMGRALGLAICWAVVSLVRSCAQAKLVGDEIGLNPIASLASIYVGWKVWGVWGMLSFPLIFSIVERLNDRGFIRLWKNA